MAKLRFPNQDDKQKPIKLHSYVSKVHKLTIGLVISACLNVAALVTLLTILYR